MSPHSESNRSAHSSAPATLRRGDDQYAKTGGGQLGPAERSGYNGRSEYGERSGNIDNAGWGDTPNPFSRVLAASEPSARSRFTRAAKTLLAMLALTALLMAGFTYGRQFLLTQLVSGFDKLDTAAQQNRLTQIAGFGTDAIEPLVEKLAAEEDAVSASAFTLLQQMQNDWVTLPTGSAIAAHDRLMRAIAGTFCPTRGFGQASDPRPVPRTRASELLRQSILEFSSTPAQASGLLASANELLAQLDGHVSSTPTLVDSPVKLGSRANVHTVAKVVPISSTIRQSGWTDWPPPVSTQPAQIIRSGAQQAKLQALPRGVTAPLRPISSSKTVTANSPAVAAHGSGGRVVQVAADEELVDSGFSQQQQRDLATSGKLLPEIVVERSAVESSDRGAFGHPSPAHSLVTKLKSAGVQERMQIADSLARCGQLESEPWISILLSDPDRRVRLQVASALEKTRNPEVLETLRKQVASENDPHVAARIRRILDLF